jgi:glycosyltransferase involved in cell wall biosynthesis
MSKVLIISERFWPEGGGGTLATYLISKLLVEGTGLDLTIITGTSNPAHINNVRFIIDPLLKPSNKLQSILLSQIAKIEGYYKNLIQSADIVYIPYGYMLIPVARKLGKKIIVHLHDYQPISYNSLILDEHQNGGFLNDVRSEAKFELFEHGDIKRCLVGSLLVAFTKAYKFWVGMADAIICVSKKQRDIIASVAPELAPKLRVIYNPIPTVSLVKKRFEKPTLLYLGGDSYVKGFYIFLEASQRVLNRHPNLKFLCAGNYRRSESKYLIGNLNKRYNEAYNLVGHLQHRRVLMLYSISRALVFPSLTEEPLPYAVLEAMLTGTVPLASRVGGIPEIVEGTYAERLTFTPGHSEELANRMEIVLSLSQNQLADISSTLRESVVKRFNNEVIKKQLLEVFSE